MNGPEDSREKQAIVKRNLAEGLLLEAGDEGADEAHVLDVVGEGNFLHHAAARRAVVVLAARGMDDVGLAGLDMHDGEVSDDLVDGPLLGVLDPVDDIAVLELFLETPVWRGAALGRIVDVLLARGCRGSPWSRPGPA